LVKKLNFAHQPAIRDNILSLYPESLDHLTACPDCDLLLPKTEAPVGYSAVCPRCGRKLGKGSEGSIAKVLAFSLTGLLMYLPAISLPLMTFNSFGFSDSANILESIVNFYRNDYYLVSLMVLLSAVVFPLILLTTIFIITLQLQRKRYPAYLAGLFRMHLHLEEWAMIEVYLLGIMVTIIKMGGTSDIHYHTGIFCFSSLVLITLAISTIVDHDLFWRTIEEKGPAEKNIPPLASFSDQEEATVNAAGQGFILCHTCHKLSPAALAGTGCPRCRTILHERKPHSVARTWALILTAAILIVPANLLPIMEVDFLGIPDRSTIMDGIVYFFQDGSYLIGLIIFTASIVVPVFKIAGLFILLLATRPGNHHFLVQKTRMFRLIAFIGRWSMLDIFVIALLSVLVDYGFFTSIHTAPAATYFSLVVAATMFATMTFDPRIIWDACCPGNETMDNDQPATLIGKMP
jgi:paraquat-inducible protein A